MPLEVISVPIINGEAESRLRYMVQEERLSCGMARFTGCFYEEGAQ